MYRIGGLWNYAATQLDTVNTTPTIFRSWEHANTPQAGIEVDATAGTLRILQPGLYLAYAMLSFIGTTGDTYFAEFRVNGAVGAGFRCCVDGITGGVSHMSVMGGSQLHEGDVVSLYVYSDNAAGSNFTLVDAQFGVFCDVG